MAGNPLAGPGTHHFTQIRGRPACCSAAPADPVNPGWPLASDSDSDSTAPIHGRVIHCDASLADGTAPALPGGTFHVPRAQDDDESPRPGQGPATSSTERGCCHRSFRWPVSLGGVGRSPMPLSGFRWQPASTSCPAGARPLQTTCRTPLQ